MNGLRFAMQDVLVCGTYDETSATGTSAGHLPPRSGGAASRWSDPQASPRRGILGFGVFVSAESADPESKAIAVGAKPPHPRPEGFAPRTPQRRFAP